MSPAKRKVAAAADFLPPAATEQTNFSHQLAAFPLAPVASARGFVHYRPARPAASAVRESVPGNVVGKAEYDFILLTFILFLLTPVVDGDK